MDDQAFDELKCGVRQQARSPAGADRATMSLTWYKISVRPVAQT